MTKREESETKLRELSQRPDVYSLLAWSLAPSIWAMDDVKKGILLQLFGGYGYMSEYPISRFFVDARIQRIYGGTNEIMKEIVARSLLGR